MRTGSLLVVPVAICAAAAHRGGGATAIIAGTWDPIKDVNDPHVQELGRWAVAEHGRQAPADAALTFVGATSGATQEFDGTNYRLVLDAWRPAAGGGREDGAYTAQVLEQDWINSRKLVSFIADK
uniref:Cysteine proteinase inhibitor n=1 Tax=Oryza punctata TaxID=4537 RepID=A0A0E0KAD0_ORYPU